LEREKEYLPFPDLPFCICDYLAVFFSPFLSVDKQAPPDVVEQTTILQWLIVFITEVFHFFC
jgi:hypothetical protein